MQQLYEVESTRDDRLVRFSIHFKPDIKNQFLMLIQNLSEEEIQQQLGTLNLDMRVLYQYLKEKLSHLYLGVKNISFGEEKAPQPEPKVNPDGTKQREITRWEFEPKADADNNDMFLFNFKKIRKNLIYLEVEDPKKEKELSSTETEEAKKAIILTVENDVNF